MQQVMAMERRLVAHFSPEGRKGLRITNYRICRRESKSRAIHECSPLSDAAIPQNLHAWQKPQMWRVSRRAGHQSVAELGG